MNNSRLLLRLALAALPFTLACDSPTEPRGMERNTVEVTVKGGLNFHDVAEARGHFQQVTGGDGHGVRIETEVQGFPLVIHIPGEPKIGRFVLGPWDPEVNLVRADTLKHSQLLQLFSFGGRPAASYAHYASLGGGTLEIDEIKLPNSQDPLKGSIRGRLNTRAVADPRLLPPGTSIPRDTIELSVEFHVELWRHAIGRATVQFEGGSLAGDGVITMAGNGATHQYMDGQKDPLLLISLVTPLAKSGERLQLWFATSLLGPGISDLSAIAPADINWASRWPGYFVAGYVGDRSITSLAGTIQLDAYDALTMNGHGAARGRVTVDLVVQDPAGAAEPEHTTAVITFDMPIVTQVSVFP